MVKQGAVPPAGFSQDLDWGCGGAPPGDTKVPCQELADLEGWMFQLS